jgi:ATP-dependent Clp protease ATP-binding subunit ClpA
MAARPKELERMGRCALLAWEHGVEKHQTSMSSAPRSGVTTGHILLGVLKEDACAGGLILRGLGVDLSHAYAITEFVLLHSRPVSGDTDPPVDWGGQPHTAPAKQVMELSLEEANLYTATYPIGTEHLLLALLRVPDSIGRRTLHFLGLQEDTVRQKRDEFWKLLRSPE